MSPVTRNALGVLSVVVFVLGATIAPAEDEPGPPATSLTDLSKADIAAAAETSVDDLAWLAGCWGKTQGTRETVECWLPPLGGLMLAMNRDASPRGAFFEYLRIAAVDGAVTYLASPLGREPTPFTLVAAGAERAVFQNLAHDFPQRITYQRRGDALDVRIEAVQNGEVKASEWTWQAMPFPAPTS